jgi:uncharacterized phage protein (TIGR01671 family)
MREILFRGKRIDNGEWVEGCLTRYSQEMSYITVDLIENEVYQVHTETVGQYTGLLDKNGKRIFEGDVHGFGDCTFEIKHGTYTDEMTGEESYGWHTYDSRVGTGCNLGESETWVNIIGNIHEGVRE